MKKAVVLQSNYIPWKGYFDLIHDADVFVHYDEVQYTKNDWRNRNRILSKNGPEWLTIPIAASAVKLKISQVTIHNNHWQTKHFKSLYFTYKSAPFFSQLEPLLEEIYQKYTWKNLSELNRFCLERIVGLLELKTEFIDSKHLKLEGDAVERLTGVLEQIGATDYFTGPSAKSYLAGREAMFDKRGIRVHYKDYAGYPEYPQLSKPFRHEVSIVDLLANVRLSEIPECIWGWRKK